MNLEQIFEESKALHMGHTEFKNGMHGDGWLQKDLIVRNPNFLDEIAKLQAEQILKLFPDVTLLMGPVTGGAIIVSHVAKYVGREYGVILGKQDPVLFHDMNIPGKSDKVVITEDVVSSGTDMTRYIKFLESSEVNLLGVSVWLNRTNKDIYGVKTISLLENPFKTYEKDKCPHCAANEDIIFSKVRE